MTALPGEFTNEMRRLLGDERFERYLKAFEEEPPVSIRLNPKKCGTWTVEHGHPVPWCQNGYYLDHRPNFTMDPLLHAGCYYVQEASSMFLDHALKSSLSTLHVSPAAALDLCAAPGGKSTLLRAALPESCMLVSNEPVSNRAQVLAENVAKWGYTGHTVTNLYPQAVRKSKQHFDLILCDVPCSGEGMFRKDPATISQWSLRNVEKCQQLQREIVAEAWRMLNDGGILIYSTCTFNTKENEENLQYFMQTLGAEVLPVPTEAAWNITGSLLPGFEEPVYRFIPGLSRGEGLFMCVLHKGRNTVYSEREYDVIRAGIQRNPRQNTMYSAPEYKQKELPSTAEVLSVAFDRTRYPEAQLDYQQAIAYLRREALQLPADTPRGPVVVTFMGQPLGMVKNIGSRANNLYPKEWKIKTTHIPQTYEAILRHT